MVLIGNFETSRKGVSRNVAQCPAMSRNVRQRLLDYTQKLSFKRVLQVSEYYTSKALIGISPSLGVIIGAKYGPLTK